MNEERLKQAARQAGQAIAGSLPEPEDCTHAFSLEYQQKMRRLSRRARRPWSRPALRAACMLLVCLLGCGMFLQVNAEAKELFLGWVGRLEDRDQHYAFSGPAAEKDSAERYVLPKIPEGYEAASIELTEHDGNMLYYNAQGQVFEFGYLKQDTVSSASSLYFQTEGMERQDAEVDGQPADLYLDGSGEGGTLLVWKDAGGRVLFYLYGHLEAEELTALAERVEKIS